MMKKMFYVALFLIAIMPAQAQNLYVGGGFGYGFRAGSTVISTNNNADGSTTVVKGSYGAGYMINLYGGYLFTKNFGLELNLGYQLGKKAIAKDDFGFTKAETKYRANSFYLNPSIVIRTSGESKVSPYVKFGFFMGFANSARQISESSTIDISGQTTLTSDTDTKIKGRLATGVTSAIGMDFKLADNLVLFGELNSRLASWSPGSYSTKYEATTYTGGTPTSTVVTNTSGNYQKDFMATFAGNDKQAEVLPFSCIGFSLGVKLFLK